MIRLPLTSISLSRADIDLHLNDIDIYHGLLKQGFRKKDVLQFFKAKNLNSNAEEERLHDTFQAPVADTVTLACQKLATIGIDASKTEGVKIVGEERFGLEKQRSSHLSHADTISPPFDLLSLCNKGNQQSSAAAHQRRSLMSGHAPRQSSLLRFSSNLSSGRSDCSDHGSNALEVDSKHLGQGESGTEVDPLIEEFGQITLDESLIPILNTANTPDTTALDLSNQPEMDDLTPLKLPSPALCGSAHTTCPFEQTKQYHSPSFSPGKRTDSMEAVVNFPSSPPLLGIRATGSEQLQRSTNRPFVDIFTDIQPSSPFHEQISAPDPLARSHSAQPVTRLIEPKSAPRSMRNRLPERLAFTIYNDTIAAEAQPQTPAQLDRHEVIDESSISYTAPPGVTTTPLGAWRDQWPFHHIDVGEPSPTVRAIDVRNRRNREYRRSVRVESLRLMRSYRRPQASDQEGTNLEEIVSTAHQEHLQSWRDELDADRIGEENFDSDPSLWTPADRRRPRLMSNSGMEEG